MGNTEWKIIPSLSSSEIEKFTWVGHNLDNINSHETNGRLVIVLESENKMILEPVIFQWYSLLENTRSDSIDTIIHGICGQWEKQLNINTDTKKINKELDNFARKVGKSNSIPVNQNVFRLSCDKTLSLLLSDENSTKLVNQSPNIIAGTIAKMASPSRCSDIKMTNVLFSKGENQRRVRSHQERIKNNISYSEFIFPLTQTTYNVQPKSHPDVRFLNSPGIQSQYKYLENI